MHTGRECGKGWLQGVGARVPTYFTRWHCQVVLVHSFRKLQDIGFGDWRWRQAKLDICNVLPRVQGESPGYATPLESLVRSLGLMEWRQAAPFRP